MLRKDKSAKKRLTTGRRPYMSYTYRPASWNSWPQLAHEPKCSNAKRRSSSVNRLLAISIFLKGPNAGAEAPDKPRSGLDGRPPAH